MWAAARELTLFAAVGMAIGGVDDLLVDAVYLVHRLRRRWTGERRLTTDELPAPRRRFAIFIPAWDEAAVIGAMLRTLATQLPHPSLAIFVGVYPNDGATIEAVAEVALDDPRIRLVVGHRSGPTTKADCLNSLWRAMIAEERVEVAPFEAIILHDAEDVVDAGELAVFDHALATAHAVQLPVLPLPRPGAHLVGGTYLDEFAEAHAKLLAVRECVGAGLPLAGVGCAIARPMLDRIAASRGGMPFDASSLTEDYELGLTIAALGGRTRLALVDRADGGGPVGVRAYFPATLDTAVRQKARWLIGIALAGWDRTGWGPARHIGEYWMRMRDRRAPIAVLVLVAAYAALLLWAIGHAATLLGGAPAPAVGPALAALLAVNGLFLLWRLAMRGLFVSRRYGVAEGFRALPRMLVGNIVAMMAARRALVRYLAMLRGAAPAWDKTAHEFPDLAEEAA
ncbi:glycosyl transferase family protein [Sphingomonas donggukensis]|uniref:Glycosyl transferase family protein n=1 Tax=Sphingomonas donggukensis TaxID=2949093 RepID=A0ABY4TUI5_9SPHN|nr:glycosyl transferase family protein [Sphingomonas donggukensis]URW75624.1 glycosyl transferase family protein [Sphingomonas donggukensis]